jgi:hypothetical protein
LVLRRWFRLNTLAKRLSFSHQLPALAYFISLFSAKPLPSGIDTNGKNAGALYQEK